MRYDDNERELEDDDAPGDTDDDDLFEEDLDAPGAADVDGLDDDSDAS